MGGGCSDESVQGGFDESGPRNVVLICWDTVRADHLGAYGYDRRPTTPVLDALAARSTVFVDASAAAGWTKPSVPSYLTGTMPAEHGVYEGSAGFELGKTTDVLPEEALTLAEVFRERGFRTAAFIKNAQLRPGNGFEQGFETYRDEVGDAKDIRWAGLDWLDGLNGEEPFFLYLHALDAHWPYAIPDEAASRFVPAERARVFQKKSFKDVMDAVHDGERDFTAEEREDLLALYDGSLRYLDEQLGAFLDGLELRGLAEDTVIVLVSDHGEEFGEHGRIGHGHGLYQGLLQVPFIAYVPGRAPERVDHPVSLLDLFPTLLGVFGMEAPDHVLGVDRLADPTADRPILAEHKAPDRYRQAVRDPSSNQKFVRDVLSANAAVGAASFPVQIGERVEAELERDGEGFHVTELDPDDDDPDDPTELKGIVRELDDEGFRIASIPIRMQSSTELKWGDDVLDHELRAGRGVKVEGGFDEGVFVAEKIKLYPLEAEIDMTLRGIVQDIALVDGKGTLLVGGLTLGVDGWTDLDFPDSGKRKKRMGREEVTRFLELGSERAVTEGFDLTSWRYDLNADPDEERRIDELGEANQFLSTLLDRLGSVLAGERVYTPGDRLHLTQDAIDALRDIGYAR